MAGVKCRVFFFVVACEQALRAKKRKEGRLKMKCLHATGTMTIIKCLLMAVVR